MLVTHAAHPVPAVVGVLAALLAHTLAARPARRAPVDDDAQLHLAAATRPRRLFLISPHGAAPPQPRQLRLEAAVGRDTCQPAGASGNHNNYALPPSAPKALLREEERLN